MAAALVDNMFGKHLKLTSTKYMLKVSEDSYMIASTLDSKKLYLTANDMETLRIKLFVFESQPCIQTKDWADAILENTIVKWIPEKNYYTLCRVKCNFFCFDQKSSK